MLGSRRNRMRHGALECVYGCCRTGVTGDKTKTRRLYRRRESQVWKKEVSRNDD
jgi:hypothetical protein